MQFSIGKQSDIAWSLTQINAYLQTIMPKGIKQTEILTICSELINNIHLHTPSGTLSVSNENPYILIIAKDCGEGFKDVKNIIKEGYSTKNSLGIGIPAIIRLSDEFEAISSPKGTKIHVKKAYE